MAKRRKHRRPKEPDEARPESDSAAEFSPFASHQGETRESLVVGRLPSDVIAAIDSAEYGVQPR